MIFAVVFVNNLPPSQRVLAVLKFENETPEVKPWLDALFPVKRVFDTNLETLVREGHEGKWNSAGGFISPEQLDQLFFD